MTNSQKKGFTLIEILIASVIFSIIMIMATLVFSLTSSYNSKIHEYRAVLENTRNTARSVTDDIRLSNGMIKATLNISGVGSSSQNVKDFYWFTTNDSGEPTAWGPSALGDNVYGSSPTYGLVIVNRTKSRVILYRMRKIDSNYQLFREEIPVADSAWSSGITIESYPALKDKFSGDDISLEFRFGGHTGESNAVVHPFVVMGALAMTEDYDTTPTTLRAKTEIQTSVESRDYNP